MRNHEDNDKKMLNVTNQEIKWLAIAPQPVLRCSLKMWKYV